MKISVLLKEGLLLLNYMEFSIDLVVKTERGFVRFSENNNFYLNKIMD